MLAGVLGVAASQAEVVTFRFSGTANFAGAPLQPYFAAGNPFTFTASYDSAATGSHSGDFSRTFPAISAVLAVSASGGSWSTTALNPEIQVVDSPTENRI
jgi:hypothetical protein